MTHSPASGLGRACWPRSAQAAAILARIIGGSEPTVSRIRKGEYPLDPNSKVGELSLLLVRVYRSLDALVGTDDQKRKDWMRGMNKALGGVPLQLIERPDGLVATLNYLMECGHRHDRLRMAHFLV